MRLSAGNGLVAFKSVGMDPLLFKRPPVQAMTHAVPISSFKSISIIFGGAGLIFEGLTKRGGCQNDEFCQGLPGVNPQRSNQGVLLRNLFWEMLFHKETGTAFR